MIKTNHIYILFYLLLCLAVSMPTYAQKKKNKVESVTITGKIIDGAGNPVADAIIYTNEGANIFYTNENGEYEIVTEKDNIILIEKEGYKGVSIREGELQVTSNITMVQTNGLEENINMPYRVTKSYQNTGLVTAIDAEEEMLTDTRRTVFNAIANKVPGMVGGGNVHGFGGATYVVDGVISDIGYLRMNEIEQITVLRDPISRALYGADGNAGVVLITTKKGEANKRIIRFDTDAGVQIEQKSSLPSYVDAATYKELYNQAQRNDAYPFIDDFEPKYSLGEIDSTRRGLDPVFLPDNDYLSSTYRNDMTWYSNVFGEMSGGSENAQYIFTTGWQQNKGWLNQLGTDQGNNFYVRGKVDFKVNKWLKTRTELVGIFATQKQTRGVDSYWSNANTRLPHTYAVLLPIDRISDFDSLANPKIVEDEYVLGGSKLYEDENLYADLAFAGEEFSMNRFVQFNTGADIDLSSITKGLAAKVYTTVGYNNQFTEFFNNSYAVYVPKDSTISTENNLFAVGEALGADEESTKRTVNDNGLFFYRDFKSYATLNYDKTFGDHEVSALYLAYLSSYTIKDEWQSYKRLRTGAHLNYAFKKKYALEAAMLWQGSDKLSSDNQWAASPSIGAGWILSEEDFLNSASAVNYLKLHASFGVLLNDNFYNDTYDGYFLHESIYQEGGGFGYGNTGGTTQGSNKARYRPYRSSQLGFQKRNEFVLGMESYLFNNTTWFQVAYFNSLHKDLVSSVYNGTPAVMGLTAPSYQNYEARRDYGVELGIKYKNNVGDFRYSLGVNYMYTDGKYVTVDEPNYVQEGIDDHLKRTGTSTRSLWGLEADGLYTSDDFEADGVTLNSDLPQPTWTRVQPGDIKYEDYNNDGYIDDDDYHIIGNSSNKHYFGFVIDLRYKNWSLFTTANAQMGGMGYTNSAYYWFKGNNAKYSEIAKNAFDIDNQDANAAYPRLTLGNGTHNYKSSTFWTYSKSYFHLNALQLAYNVKNGVPAIGLKEVKIFGRGSNLLYVAKDKDVMRLRYKSSPQSWVTALGIIATF